MTQIWHELKMLFVGTVRLTTKKSRTASSFPYHKLSGGALRSVSRGWDRRATSNVKINGRVAFTMQATTWKDKKQVALLHNTDVNVTDGSRTAVKRYSPRKKIRRDISSPTIVKKYQESFNGVDQMDRDRADWSITMKSNRWYLRIYYWVIDAAIHCTYLLVCAIARKRSENGTDDKWLKYTKKDGRMKFQMDLALSLIEAGILLDTNGADPKLLKDKANRPSFMRQDNFHPCGCGICFFCKHKITHGVEHKSWHFRNYVATPPPGEEAVHPRYPQKSVPMGTTGDCAVCMKREEVRCNGEVTRTELRKMKRNNKSIIGRSTRGCNVCGVRVCKSCWPTYNHDLSS